jgi:WD40-like Beta Propeller Repeat
VFANSLAVAAAGLLAWPGAASATFPGRNGQLATLGWPSSGYSTIRHVYPNGDQPARIAADEKWLAYPSYSPNGMRIVYTVRGSGGETVWSARWNGTDRRAIRNGGYQTPSWSADGRRIVAGFACDCQPKLYIFASNGSGDVRVLSPFPAATVSYIGAIGPAWSPAGRLIAFIADVGTREEEVYSVHPDGSGLRRLTYTTVNGDYTLYKSRLDWSPDGSRLTFSENVQLAGGAIGSKVIVMNADGSHQRAIADGNQPLFSPNGRFVVYTSRDGSLRRIDADGRHDAPYPYPMPFQFGDPEAWQPLPGTRRPSLHVAIRYTRLPAEIVLDATVGPARGRELVTARLYHRVQDDWVLVAADQRLTGRRGRYREGLEPQLSGTCLLRFHYFGDPQYLPVSRSLTFSCHKPRT